MLLPGVCPHFLDLPDEVGHQVAAQKDHVQGQAGVDVLAQRPEPAAHPVHQVPLILADEVGHRAMLFDGGGQLGPGVPLIVDEIIDKDHAHIVGQLRKQLDIALPVLLPALEQVEVGHLDHGPLPHHGQAVDGLLQGVGGHVLGLQLVKIKGPHAPGEQLLPQAAQVVVPEVSLLPMEDIQLPRVLVRQVLFQFLISGGVRLLLGRHGCPSSLFGLVCPAADGDRPL